MKKERKFEFVRSPAGLDAFAVDGEKYSLYEAVMMLYEHEPEKALQSWRLVKSWLTADGRRGPDGEREAFPIWLFIFDKNMIESMGEIDCTECIHLEEAPGYE